MRVVFWQPTLSIHQSAHIRALAGRAIGTVILVAQDELDEARRAVWSLPSFGDATVAFRPDEGEVERLVREQPEDSFHIFSGIRAYPMVAKAFRRCLPTAARMGLLVEEPDGVRGFKGRARHLLARSDCRRFGDRISFILAISQRSVRWYRGCGYSAARVYPYGYFVESPAFDRDAGSRLDEDGLVRLIYLGRCVPSKGVDLLLRALTPLARLDWALTVMGDGPTKVRWIDAARRLGLAGRVRFEPARPYPLALQALNDSDLLILPSSGKEGWGAVVNEALMLGVPVICSNHCGAADLLRASWRGEVFAANCVPGLRGVLERWIVRGRRSAALTERIRAWSGRITGEAAAGYLIDVLQAAAGRGPRPEAPWLLPEEEAVGPRLGVF